MGQKSGPVKEPAERVVKEIGRATRRQFSAEEKIRIVLSGLRGEDSIAELCRREGIVQNLHYRWSKEFLEGGKKRLAGDAARAATVAWKLCTTMKAEDVTATLDLALLASGLDQAAPADRPRLLSDNVRKRDRG